MEKKTFWRCSICGDLHYGVRPPEKCPTCGFPADKAVAISQDEFVKTVSE